MTRIHALLGSLRLAIPLLALIAPATSAGEPSSVRAGKERVSRDVRQWIANEIMYRLAAPLPPPYRGEYGYLDAAIERYLRPVSPAARGL